MCNNKAPSPILTIGRCNKYRHPKTVCFPLWLLEQASLSTTIAPGWMSRLERSNRTDSPKMYHEPTVVMCCIRWLGRAPSSYERRWAEPSPDSVTRTTATWIPSTNSPGPTDTLGGKNNSPTTNVSLRPHLVSRKESITYMPTKSSATKDTTLRTVTVTGSTMLVLPTPVSDWPRSHHPLTVTSLIPSWITPTFCSIVQGLRGSRPNTSPFNANLSS